MTAVEYSSYCSGEVTTRNGPVVSGTRVIEATPIFPLRSSAETTTVIWESRSAEGNENEKLPSEAGVRDVVAGSLSRISHEELTIKEETFPALIFPDPSRSTIIPDTVTADSNSEP